MDRAATMNKPGRVSIAVAIVAMTASVSTCPHVDGTPALNRSRKCSIENAPSSPSLSHPLLKSQTGKSTGPFYCLPIVVGSPGRGENIHLESFYSTALCCLLTLSKACERARPSKVSDMRPSSILCKYLIINDS